MKKPKICVIDVDTARELLETFGYKILKDYIISIKGGEKKNGPGKTMGNDKSNN